MVVPPKKFPVQGAAVREGRAAGRDHPCKRGRGTLQNWPGARRARTGPSLSSEPDGAGDAKCVGDRKRRAERRERRKGGEKGGREGRQAARAAGQ
eukprot:14109525-Heterocapsa_arctica.AAC.1